MKSPRLHRDWQKACQPSGPGKASESRYDAWGRLRHPAETDRQILPYLWYFLALSGGFHSARRLPDMARHANIRTQGFGYDPLRRQRQSAAGTGCHAAGSDVCRPSRRDAGGPRHAGRPRHAAPGHSIHIPHARRGCAAGGGRASRGCDAGRIGPARAGRRNATSGGTGLSRGCGSPHPHCSGGAPLGCACPCSSRIAWGRRGDQRRARDGGSGHSDTGHSDIDGRCRAAR